MQCRHDAVYTKLCNFAGHSIPLHARTASIKEVFLTMENFASSWESARNNRETFGWKFQTKCFQANSYRRFFVEFWTFKRNFTQPFGRAIFFDRQQQFHKINTVIPQPVVHASQMVVPVEHINENSEVVFGWQKSVLVAFVRNLKKITFWKKQLKYKGTKLQFFKFALSYGPKNINVPEDQI